MARRPRRLLLVGALVLVCGVASPLWAAVVMKDLRGRTVTLTKPATRVLIDDGRYLVALSLLHPDPVSLIAAWPRDINRIGDDAYARFNAGTARLERVPLVSSSAGAFSLERALDVRPELAVFSLGHGPTDAQVVQLEAAGIAVVFIDFFSHPFDNLEPSLRLLGQAVGREQQADAFIAFRHTRTARIAARLATATGPKPRVFLEAHAGMSADCCNSPGKGNVGDYIDFVGGHNIGADVLPGPAGKLNVEYVIAQNPAVYIATGGPHLEKTGGLVLGPGYAVDRARQSLLTVTTRPLLAQLPAVAAGRAYGLSHQLLNSPLDIVAIEAMATWIRPDLFGDIDPADTMRAINRQFLSIPLEGVYWISAR